jgi:hypothetical protein
MKRSKTEAEVIVRLDFLDKKAHICVNQWPAMAARMRRRYGAPWDSGQLVERWVVPLKAVSFRSLARKPKQSKKATRMAVLASGVPQNRHSSHAEVSGQEKHHSALEEVRKT